MMKSRVETLRDWAMQTRPLKNGSVQPPIAARGSSGVSPITLRAQAIAEMYQRRPVVIQDGELIVGGNPREYIGDGASPKIFGRQNWSSGTVWEQPEQIETFFSEGMLSWAGNHKTLDYDTVFDMGLAGIRSQISTRIKEIKSLAGQDIRGLQFLEALDMVAVGFLEFTKRHAEEAKSLVENLELAQTGTREIGRGSQAARRRWELLEIARICRKIPAQPPESFWEACQCAWFAFLLVPDAPGRLDQYLYPFYKRGIASDEISRDFAKELPSCLWINYFEYVGVEGGVSAHNHLTLAGLTPEGENGVNEVTHLCLEVIEELKLNRPQVGFRWNSKTPRSALEHAVQILRAQTGNPDFCNDDVIVPALERIGVSTVDARNFSLSGCHEVIVTGMSQMGSVEGFVNMSKIVRMALGLEPGLYPPPDMSSIDSFEAFWTHVEGAMKVVSQAAHKASVCRDRQSAKAFDKDLEVSLVTRDCIKNGSGYAEGGARYNFCNWNVIGIANLADSVSAIKSMVFEKHAISLADLRDVLDSNWRDQRQLRTRIMNQSPRYGNDNSVADSLVIRIIDSFRTSLEEYSPYRGGKYILGTTAGGENMHMEFGRITGATPDGRLDGDPLADSVGPAQGRDTNGITAMLNSAAKLPHITLPTATTLNARLDGKLLKGAEGVAKIASLIDGHFTAGGQQLQFNFYDRELLVDAKKHPESYSGLMVRVAGYSAPFVSLWGDLQDEIITRTEHSI